MKPYFANRDIILYYHPISDIALRRSKSLFNTCDKALTGTPYEDTVGLFLHREGSKDKMCGGDGGKSDRAASSGQQPRKRGQQVNVCSSATHRCLKASFSFDSFDCHIYPKRLTRCARAALESHMTC